MDKEKYEIAYIGNALCPSCIHLFINNGEEGWGCRAFPKGIPLEAKHGHNHHSVIRGQIGDFVYRKAEYEELSPFTKYLYKLLQSK